MPARTHPQVQHPSLRSTFRGITHRISSSETPVHQYRGIKYANIPGRFLRSTILGAEHYQPQVDCSKYGPICPQPKLYRNLDETQYGLLPTQFPVEAFTQDEFQCLNLNITSPGTENHELYPNGYPVMLWVHGGGNIGGAGSRWLLDGGNLVKRSMQIGKPLLMVTLNYRLGLFGFAASPSLKPKDGSEGIGNYGLHDQLLAVHWVSRNIAAFGGDPSRITICGEGKGAIDIHALLLSGYLTTRSSITSKPLSKPLVWRAILQSGTCPPTLPNPGMQHVELSRVMSNLGLECASVDELRSVEAMKLVGATVKGIKISPTDDGAFFPKGALRSSSKNLGIEAILLGDTHTESTPYILPASKWTSVSLSRRIKAVLRSPYKSDALLRAFEVSEEDEEISGHDEIAERIGELIGDCLVGYGVERLANRLAPIEEEEGEGKRTRVYRFTFDQPSPFNSSAHHAVDLVYLFGNIDFAPPPSSDSDDDGFKDDAFGDSFMTTADEQRVCETMQGKWIEFCHGEEVWGEYLPGSGTPLSYSIPPSPPSFSPLPRTPLSQSITLPPPASGKGEVFIFGPTGDAYPAPVSELGWRRRVDKWRDAFEGGEEGEERERLEEGEVIRVGMELANGPIEWKRY